ncbi:alpha/beta hydrolase [Neobacillus kokaensis]|uniref:Esterase n=1 Tax=Neobacillus kokaensis TaxID=2759023 RepID=A0ABQ3NBD1_9BACI|nr:alpha/beta hydrolase [Neobacillus kokaensis]GHI01213.1 esterase [Neobacillus kokaensis]
MKKRYLLLMMIVFIAGLNFCQTAEGKEFKQRNLTYGDDPRQKLDVYAPNIKSSHSYPVIIYVHGGGWMRGDKFNVADKPSFFINKGYVFVSVNYRLSPKVTYKEMAKDISSAIKWVHDHAAQYHIDKNRINLMGHSAGGHLVTLIATNPHFLNQAGLTQEMVNSVVNLDGPIDLVEYIPKNERYKKVFGQDRQVWAEASPVSYAGQQQLPPMLLVGPERSSTSLFIKETTNASNSVQMFKTHTLTHKEITKLLGAGNSPEEARNMTTAVIGFLKTYNQSR